MKNQVQFLFFLGFSLLVLASCKSNDIDGKNSANPKTSNTDSASIDAIQESLSLAAPTQTTACVATNEVMLRQCIDRVNNGTESNVQIAAGIACSTCSFTIKNCNRPILIFGKTGINAGIRRSSLTPAKPILEVSDCKPTDGGIKIRNLKLEDANTLVPPDDKRYPLLKIARSHNVDVDSVTILNSKSFGLSIEGSKNVTVRKSTITNSSFMALWMPSHAIIATYPSIESENISFISNVFNNNQGNISYTSKGGVIRGNTFNHNHRIPFVGWSGGQVVFETPTTNVLFKSNEIINGSIDDQTNCGKGTNGYQQPPCIVGGLEFPGRSTVDPYLGVNSNITIANNDFRDLTAWGSAKGKEVAGDYTGTGQTAVTHKNISYTENRFYNNTQVKAQPDVNSANGWITASPATCSIVDQDLCTSKITWGSTGVSNVEVRIGTSVAAMAPSGAFDAPWIGANGVPLDLYGNGSKIASTFARGSLDIWMPEALKTNNCFGSTCALKRPRGTITASPNPCILGSNGLCSSVITWSATEVTNAEVRINGSVFGRALSQSATAPWIGASGGVFELYSDTGELLNSVFVGGITPSSQISGTITPAVAGITVKAGTFTTLTDATGAYMFTGLPSGTFTVTPSKVGCTFSPVSTTVTLNNSAALKTFLASTGCK